MTPANDNHLLLEHADLSALVGTLEIRLRNVPERSRATAGDLLRSAVDLMVDKVNGGSA